MKWPKHLACMGTALVLGCAGNDATRSKAPEVTPPAQIVAELRLYLSPQPGTPEEIAQAVELALSSAGYVLVTTREEADLEAVLQVQRTEQKGFVTMVVDGKRVVDYRNVVLIQLRDGSSIVESVRVEFEAEAGEVDDRKIAFIPNSFSHSRRLLRFAQGLQRREAEEALQAKRQADKEAARRNAATKEAQRRKDDLAWLEAQPEDCARPTKVDACQGVKRYLIEHPDGLHAVKASKMLGEAEGKLEALAADDRAWQQSGHQACVPGATVEDCVGVEIYLEKYPAGFHEVEARTLLRESGVRE